MWSRIFVDVDLRIALLRAVEALLKLGVLALLIYSNLFICKIEHAFVVISNALSLYEFE